MAKFSEETLINFISEFVGIIEDFGPVLETQEWPHMYHYYLEDDYFFRYSGKMVYLCDVLEYNSEEEKCSLDEFGDHASERVRDFAGDKDVIAYFGCEGVLYEDLYEFEAYGAHPKVEGLLDKLRACADKYGLYWEWADGALKFYDATEVLCDIGENSMNERTKKIIKHLVHDYKFSKEFKFHNENNALMESANALDNPIMVISPEGDADELRVWVYGGCIATISPKDGIIKISDKKKSISENTLDKNKSILKSENIKPYDYGKYLLDGYTNGHGCVYRLSEGIKNKFANGDPLGAYKQYDNFLKERQKSHEEIDEALLDLIVFASYTRWLKWKKGYMWPLYASEKFMQCVIAKNSMMESKYDPDNNSMVVIDVEYHFLKEKKKRADFVVFDGKSFGLVEFKYLGHSMTGENSLQNHHNHFDEALKEKIQKKNIIDELIGKTELLCKYEIIDKSWESAICEYKKFNNPNDLWCGFYFLGDGKDINDNSSYSDVIKQINAQLKPKYKNRVPARCKVSDKITGGIIDDLSIGGVWRDMREFF